MSQDDTNTMLQHASAKVCCAYCIQNLAEISYENKIFWIKNIENT